MATTITDYGAVTVLTLKEDFVEEEVEEFRDRAAQCMKERKLNVIVDCSGIAAMSSLALEALVDFQNQCEDELGLVKLCGLDDTCRKIMEITRLSRRFEMFDELESAVKSFG